MDADPAKLPTHTSFSPPLLFHPKTHHTHTIILLHGRGSTGQEFADELFTSCTSAAESLRDSLPGWLWVFPSSKEGWNSKFQESMPMWFDTPSSIEPSTDAVNHSSGIEDSVTHILQVLRDETERLGGRADNIVLGGISQGGAVAMWALLALLAANGTDGPIPGGVVGMSTWLPFAPEVQSSLDRDITCTQSPDGFIRRTLSCLRKRTEEGVFCSIPAFMGHGTDDAYVDIKLGREAAHILLGFGLKVEWKEYVGAEQEGHWIQIPDEINDFVSFLHRIET